MRNTTNAHDHGSGRREKKKVVILFFFFLAPAYHVTMKITI